MRYFLTLILAAASVASANGQTLPEYDYAYPVKGVQRLYSANFGEMRPNHFHSGIDIKTDGATGKEVVAVSDGYITRLVVQPGGYGRALYVVHNDGTTSVYGHLSKFRSDIEKYVREERLRRRQNRVDLYFAPWQWKVTKGETIAFSGNTGTSYGPHLHFELRQSATARTMNTMAMGIISPKDDIPPAIVRLHYIEVDTLHGVPVNAPRKTYEVRSRVGGGYELADSVVAVGRNGYFVVEVTDRKNDVQNRFGVYRLCWSEDGQKRFEYTMNGFTFDRSRYCNAVSYYPIQLTSKTEAIRLARIDGNRRDFYRTLVDDGRISAAAGESKLIEIEAEDDCGNISQIAFDIVGKDDDRCFRATEGMAEEFVVDRNKDFRFGNGEIDVAIPAGALYESVFFKYVKDAKKCASTPSVRILSPLHSVLDASVPLHIGMTVSIRYDGPDHLRSKAVLARRNANGKPVYAGGKYEEDGTVSATVTTAGDYMIAADTVPPTVKPRFADGADLSKSSTLSFDIADNFSGVASYEGTIDGQWAIFDWMPVSGRLIHNFVDGNLTRGKRHTVRMTLIDNCGNRRTVESHFYR